MKSALYFIYSAYLFRVAAAQCKQICPERLNWPGRLAGISPSFLSQKSQSQHSIFQPAHRISSSWCVRLQSLIYFDKKHYCIILKQFFSYFQADRHGDRGLGHHPPHTTSSGASPATMAANQRLTLHRNPNQPHIYK